jgi:hypothetical protein
MEMELDLSRADSTKPLDQTVGFIVLLTVPYDILELGPWLDGKGGLIDRLIPSVQFRNDEMASSPEGQHASRISIMVGPQPPKAR